MAVIQSRAREAPNELAQRLNRRILAPKFVRGDFGRSHSLNNKFAGLIIAILVLDCSLITDGISIDPREPDLA